MNHLEKSRLLRVMKVVTDVALVCLATWFVLSLILVFARSIVPDYAFINKEKFDFFNDSVKMELHFLVIARIALYIFIFYQLRKIIRNLTFLHPFEKENISRVRFIGFSIMIVGIFSIMKNYLFYSYQSITHHYYNPGRMIFDLAPSLFIGIIVLVVAEVFRRGAEMYDDQKLIV
ncbi:DUF2975 domain-containing protein [Candidatus Omnitrophota bacterium]